MADETDISNDTKSTDIKERKKETCIAMNREDNVFYNASGYPDPTAAEAIRKIQDTTVKPYEIWKRSGQKLLILSEKEGFVTYTSVYGAPTEYHNFKCAYGYINTGKIAHGRSESMESLVYTLSELDISALKQTLAKQFGISDIPNETSRSDYESMIAYKAKAAIYQKLYEGLIAKLIP